MRNLNVVFRQLLVEESRITTQLAAIDGALRALNRSPKRSPRTMSAAARERIAAAQRKRWAKWKKARKSARTTAH